MTGRPHLLQDEVHAELRAAGLSGHDFDSLIAARPHLVRVQLKHALGRLTERGHAFKLKQGQLLRYFSTEVSREEAEALMAPVFAAAAAAREEKRKATIRRIAREVWKRGAAERAAAKEARAEARKAQRERKAQEAMARKGERKRARAEKRASQSAANLIARRIKGGALPKEFGPDFSRAAVTIPAHVKVQACPAPRGRYEPRADELTGLSRLPLGTYAEPASTWAQAAIKEAA